MSPRKARHQGGDHWPETSSSGITTPPESSDPLSDSQFNYEIQNNWSVIFTDDNNSTDYDVRSNCSSSLDDAAVDNEMDVVSDTDSEYPAFKFLSSRKGVGQSNSTLKPVVETDSQEDSHATLRAATPDKQEGGSYSFPDPLEDSTHHSEPKSTAKDKASQTSSNRSLAPPPWVDNVKSYFVYAVLGLLVLDRSIQLFDLGLPSSKLFFAPRKDPQLTIEPVTTHVHDNALTVTQIATKTETFFIPDTTTSIETVYKTIAPTLTPSWQLVKQLYANLLTDAKLTGESLWDKGLALGSETSRVASEKLNDIKGSDAASAAAQWFSWTKHPFWFSGGPFKNNAYSTKLAACTETLKGIEKRIGSHVSGIFRSTQANILDMVGAASRSAASIKENGIHQLYRKYADSHPLAPHLGLVKGVSLGSPAFSQEKLSQMLKELEGHAITGPLKVHAKLRAWLHDLSTYDRLQIAQESAERVFGFTCQATLRAKENAQSAIDSFVENFIHPATADASHLMVDSPEKLKKAAAKTHKVLDGALKDAMLALETTHNYNVARFWKSSSYSTRATLNSLSKKPVQVEHCKPRFFGGKACEQETSHENHDHRRR